MKLSIASYVLSGAHEIGPESTEARCCCVVVALWRAAIYACRVLYLRQGVRAESSPRRLHRAAERYRTSRECWRWGRGAAWWPSVRDAGTVGWSWRPSGAQLWSISAQLPCPPRCCHFSDVQPINHRHTCNVQEDCVIRDYFQGRGPTERSGETPGSEGSNKKGAEDHAAPKKYMLMDCILEGDRTQTRKNTH